MNRVPGNPLALGLVIVGAAIMVISTFLPFNEPTGLFRMIEHNTLIQHGGWTFIALAVGIAAGGFAGSQRRGGWLALPIALSLLAASQVFDWATDENSRTLYPVGINGTIDTSKPGTVAALGIALYVAGVGVALALIGSLMLLRAPREVLVNDELVSAWEARATKKCPDCAETILADAKVCKHCGFRFGGGGLHGTSRASSQASASRGTELEEAPVKSTKVRCHKCRHVQAVPQDLTVFVCEECGARLKRRTTAS